MNSAELIGTDLNTQAIAIAKANVAAARQLNGGLLGASDALRGVESTFEACDFRDAPARVSALRAARVSLIISNPPLGRRVRVRNLHALFADLFELSAELLRPHGRLVLINPLRATPRGPTCLRLESRRVVDLGLRHGCGVEVWRKVDGSDELGALQKDEPR